ncbi:MAG TPA: hypothetical protein G4O08_09855 [Anaerolineae bacterium]|nr:hypothetical protein [Anaerolineae bacterium]
MSMLVSQIPSWILVLTGILSLAWLAISKRSRPENENQDLPPDAEEAETSPPAAPVPKLTWKNLRARAANEFRQNRTTLTWIAVGIAVAIMIWYLSPRAFSRQTTDPGQPGHPLYAFTFVRGFQLRNARSYAYVLAIALGLLSLGLLIKAHIQKKPQCAQTNLLLSAIGLASLAQLIHLEFYTGSLFIQYVMALSFLLAWFFGYQAQLKNDILTTRWSKRLEVGLLLIPLLLTLLARFSFLNDIPYGIEGDESKWTVEVVASMIDGVFPHSTTYHLSSVPASFYMQAPFHHLFGPNMLSARIAVAFYSVLGSLAFYWLARQLTNPPVAWLASMLLSVSIFDVSASRLANVESFVKLWPVLTLALLVHASRTGKKSTYLFAGIASAIGVLTYDTVAPLIPLALVLIVYELIRAKVPIAESIRRLTAYIIPILAIAPVTATYLLGRMQYYDLANKGWGSNTLQSLFSHLGDIFHSMFEHTWTDFLYNRDGPLFNSLLIPWLLAGFLLSLIFWKRGRLLWVLLFAVFFFFPVPILTNSPMGRVLYPGLPAAYLMMAIALMTGLRALQRALGPALQPLVSSLAALALGFICVLNLYIYFNEVQDPGDRRIRREIYEAVRSVSSPESVTLLPYSPKGDDPIQQEGEQITWLAVRSIADSPDDLPLALTLPIADLLPTISGLPTEIESANLIWDHFSTHARDEREAILSTVLTCYSEYEFQEGVFFDRFTFSAETLQAPICYSGTLSLEPITTELMDDQSTSLSWKMTGASASDLTLECSSIREDLLWVPGEDFRGTGWEGIDRYVTGYYGSGFLTDHQGSQTAFLTVEAPDESPLYVWLRTLRRVNDQYAGYLIIESESYTFSNAGSVPLNEWTWERIGPFQTDPGFIELRIERPYPREQAGYMALFIDTLLITASDSFDPNLDSIWEPSLKMDIPIRGEASEGSFLLSPNPGRYHCSLHALHGNRLIDPLGNLGLRSNSIEILVLPAAE